ncbi:hypothetical protein O4159_16175 [Gordonia terrae]|uniref:helix-turn-helix domain-containing protein n=1 Tax=Gordonia hongkongensis TaxID=1701090 RepID=UPI0022B4D721|nr:hypothetical protein [Gordonia terrae]
MPNIDDEAKAWQLERSRVMGAAVARHRREAGLTATQLAARCADLGYPMSRVAISKIESNSRAGKFDISELVVLAASIGVPPVMLLYPELPDGEMEVLPGQPSTGGLSMQWFEGAARTVFAKDDTTDRRHFRRMLEAINDMRDIREYLDVQSALSGARLEATAARGLGDTKKQAAAEAEMAEIRRNARQLMRSLRAGGYHIADEESADG